MSANRLLVVDDEPAIGRVVRRIAAGAGFEVTVTDSPDAFLEAVRVWQPAIILMDLNMPNTDGLQLLGALVEDKCTAHVVITSGADEDRLREAVSFGAEHGLKMGGMLQKPIRVDELRAKLASFESS